jgi:glycine hydroxymethyltransferase
MTTRGFKEEEAIILSNLIADLLDSPEDLEVLESVKLGVSELTKKFPVYGN